MNIVIDSGEESYSTKMFYIEESHLFMTDA